MKKILFALALIVCAKFVSAQAAWIEPDPTDVSKTVRIYVDLDKLDATKEATARLLADPGPFYMWTWSPAELPVGNPKVNGEGEKPWQNSNEILKLTKDDTKGPNVFYYDMIPTEFYEVAAAKVYEKGINFLVKPKNGGGYGDPDIKSEDLTIAVNPPKTDKGTLYPFPSVMLQDRLVAIVYDNTKELKTTMQNLADGDVLVYMKASVEDTATAVVTTIEPSKFLQLQNNPKLTMKKDASGKFKLYIIPDQFFHIPAGLILKDIEVTIRKRAWASGADQIDQRIKFKGGCQ
ncbi:MAG: hypothetical protein K9I48_03835 [Sphingobacteriales bacterium]|nr:hypothetical protein [Sphingobacteriales bacterium]